MNLFKKFVADDSGATAIEYGLIAALVAVVVITALTLLGGQLSDTFQEICESVAGAGNESECVPATEG